MHHFTDPQLAALRAARDGKGLQKTGLFWHAANSKPSVGEYWPDRKSVFSTETVNALHECGAIDGGGRITEEGRQVLAASKRSVLRRIESEFALGAVDARNALQARRR